MSGNKKENPGRGLSEEDLASIFPGPDVENLPPDEADDQSQSPRLAEPLRQHDYKKAQAGDLELEEAPKQDFSAEPWPSPEDIRDVGSMEQAKAQGIEGPAVQELAKTVGSSMIDSTKTPGKRILERVRNDLRPSDKTWHMEIDRIFGKDQHL